MSLQWEIHGGYPNGLGLSPVIPGGLHTQFSTCPQNKSGDNWKGCHGGKVQRCPEFSAQGAIASSQLQGPKVACGSKPMGPAAHPVPGGLRTHSINSFAPTVHG